MPVNKSARFRFEIIDECLRNTKKKWSKAELLRYVNRRLESQYGEGFVVSISQLRYDLEHMQSAYHAPIEMYRSGKNYYYRYEDTDFSIKNIPVNEEEITKLNIAVQVLRQIKVFSIADEIAEIVKKLEARCNFTVEEQRDIIIFETAQSITDKEILEDVYHAIIRKNVLKISYNEPRSKTLKIYNVHPYLLKEYDKVWHLVGYCQETSKIGIYELDRLKEVRISKLPYISDLFLITEHYFQHIIGITKPTEEVQTIRLLFSRHKALHILSHPIHHSQQVIKQYPDGKLEISLMMITNREFLNLLLSFGEHVVVLAPGKLISELSGIIKNVASCYSS